MGDVYGDLFNLLPADQAKEMMELWREFEEMKTPEAKFAASLDRF
ncbi:HD domain-containing protein [Desulfitobacterium sp. AusDCA]